MYKLYFKIAIRYLFKNKPYSFINILDKTISAFYNGEKATLTVTGILQDIPQNTHMKTDFPISMVTFNNWFASEGQVAPNYWGHCNFFTYLNVDKNANYSLLKNNGRIPITDIQNK